MTAICPRCSAVRAAGHWVHDDDRLNEAKRDEGSDSVLCPGCDRLAKHRVDGVVTLRSRMLTEHREEAMNLIHNVADRASGNIAARIVDIEDHGAEIQVTTTDQHLAERIGKEFERAFSGELEIQWPKGEEFVRVLWERA